MIKYIVIFFSIIVICATAGYVSYNHLEEVKIQEYCTSDASWVFVPYQGTFGYVLLNTCTGELKQGYLDIIEKRRKELMGSAKPSNKINI